ncbi:MAG TPA: LytTR family DNA-binding domain-containing protein [Spirochaetota bacterium]|nr:response regulator transcription factor [Spirochaetota bacterium]HOD13127.1 LytTR family DNA-binding domain-containing protein [Spirochaetota bacterium]HQL80936.1 LytTR family DNA-binding domain-containing protein [Spirochaetota bacterium]
MKAENVYSVLIAEDEVPARELLVDYLLTRNELKLSGLARTGEEALRQMTERDFDLVLLDIRLPQLTGLEVLGRLKKPPAVIFTTAYDSYAIKAFDFGAVDYLLKPFGIDRFNRSIDKFIAARDADERAAPESGFTVREGGRLHILPYQDIIYVTSHGKNTVIHTVAGDREAPVLLKDVELRLPSKMFARIHKQHIVNVRYISWIEYLIGGQYLAFLNDEDESSLTVGRKYAPLLKARLGME